MIPFPSTANLLFATRIKKKNEKQYVQCAYLKTKTQFVIRYIHTIFT